MSNQVAIWPLATPMTESGMMANSVQGVFGRGVARAIAEGLARTKICDIVLCLPVVRASEITSWAVLGRQWTLDEILQLPLPADVSFVLVGSLVITDYVDIQISLVSRPVRQTLVERSFNYARAQSLSCLSEVVRVTAEAIAGCKLTDSQDEAVGDWGTPDPEAYLAYLQGWSAAAALRFGVSFESRDALTQTGLGEDCSG
jgi:hypothetical protein